MAGPRKYLRRRVRPRSLATVRWKVEIFTQSNGIDIDIEQVELRDKGVDQRAECVVNGERIPSTSAGVSRFHAQVAMHASAFTRALVLALVIG